MAVGKKSILRAVDSVKVANQKSEECDSVVVDRKDTTNIQEEKFRIISRIKSDLPDYLL